MRRALVLFTFAWMACGESQSATAPSTRSCLMPGPDGGFWETCVPDAAIRGDLAAESGSDPRACAADSGCTRAEYPCARTDDGDGHVCLGQFAAWPMPDSSPLAATGPNYTVTPEEGTVLDEVTGLLWQRDLPGVYAGCTGVSTSTRGATCTWEEAKRYCEALRLADRRWRLPSLIELASLLDFAHSGDLTRPLIDLDAFPSAFDIDAFWSITSSLIAYASQRDAASGVSFLIGSLTNVRLKSRPAAVRCVSSARIASVASERYAIDEDSASVRDAATQLEWQSGSAHLAASFEEAADYCANHGRRIPTLKELFTQLDLDRGEIPVDPAFEAAPGQVLFSTTVGRFGQRLYYASDLGAVWRQSEVEDPFYELVTAVRCVR